MPEDRDTEYSTPIPLRDNGSGQYSEAMPNPYTRLEAVRSVETRLKRLVDELHRRDRAPVPGTLEAALLIAAEDLHACLWDSLAAVERVRAAEDPSHQFALMWPAAEQ